MNDQAPHYLATKLRYECLTCCHSGLWRVASTAYEIRNSK